MRRTLQPSGISRVLLLLCLLAPRALQAQQPTIEGIVVHGLFRMSQEALLHALAVKEGDPYDAARIRERFKELWNLNLFEDISIESENGPKGGIVLIVKVKERPVVTTITYDESKVVTRTEIEDTYKERKIKLDPGKPLDMGTVFFAEAAVRDLLAEKGYLDSTVKAEVRRVTKTTRAIHFTIKSGGKTRIRQIDFVGNELFSDRKIKKQLKLTRERRWWWPWSQKNLYHPIKWDQDTASIRDLYQNRGYLDVEIRPPVVDVLESRKAGRSDRPAEAPDERAAAASTEPGGPDGSGTLSAKQEEKERKKREKAQKRADKAQAKAGKRWVLLTVPVTEGPQYRLGTIEIEGHEKFGEELLRAAIPLKEGDVLHNGLLDFGVERITRLYEDQGHLYATVVRRIERRKGENVADVAVTVEEDKPYYVGRIEFLGNSQTHDRVLRRELQLMEGDLFNRTLLERSTAKINQLGYFQVREEPVIEAIENEQRVRVTFPGEEQGRNEIQVGGGYSGLDGAFFNGIYSTRNFLGRGQILSVALQIGGRSDRYQISFQEPWFLNRPYLLGVSLFRRDTNYGSTLRSTSDGGGIVLGKRLTPYSRLDLSYGLENVSSTSVARGADNTRLVFSAENQISSLTPVYSYNTVNNPYRPSRGESFALSFQIAGGPLGGDTSYLKPVASFTAYRRAFTRKHYFGFNVETGIVREFADGTTSNSTTIEGVPRFQRFWLGGDTLGPRVFETRTITPRRYVLLDENDRIVEVLGDPRFLSADDLVSSGGVPVVVEVGGDRMYLVQSEYVVPLNEQAEVAFFVDMGDTLFEDTSFGFDTMRMSAGVELRFHLPIFPVPLRLIYGVPVRKLEGDRTSNFTFSIGRSF